MRPSIQQNYHELCLPVPVVRIVGMIQAGYSKTLGDGSLADL